MNEKLLKDNRDYFYSIFKSEPMLTCFSPGRVNMIGEHIDYNNGYCIVGAIDKYICLSISKSQNDICKIFSKSFNENIEFNIKEEITPVKKQWANYILGVLHQLKKKAFKIEAFELVINSNIPIGIGLSSSAALECGFIFAMNELFKLGLEKTQIIKICQRAENDFVGVNCGIMDQFANMFCKEDYFSKLDCDKLIYENLSLNTKEISIILLNSKVKHSLSSSEYNTRRNESIEALSILKSKLKGVNNFRDIELSDIFKLRKVLGENLFKRAIYIVSEIERVKKASKYILSNDIEMLGNLMYETHEGLSQQYDVSCQEIDFIVGLTKEEKNVLGSRMMGGGFGGSIINIFKKGHEDRIISTIKEKYFSKFKIVIDSYQIKLVNGTYCV